MADRLLFTGHRIAQRNGRIAAGESLCASFVPRRSTVGAARQYCTSCSRHRDHHTEEPIQVNVDRADLATPRPGPGQSTHVDRLDTSASTGRDDGVSRTLPATAGEEPYIALAASVANAVRRGKSDEAIAMLETVVTLDHVLGNPQATTPRQANAEAGDQFIRRLIQGTMTSTSFYTVTCLTDFPALHRSPCVVRRALLGGHACGMLICACDPML